jgi:hypothetical protein
MCLQYRYVIESSGESKSKSPENGTRTRVQVTDSSTTSLLHAADIKTIVKLHFDYINMLLTELVAGFYILCISIAATPMDVTDKSPHMYNDNQRRWKNGLVEIFVDQ